MKYSKDFFVSPEVLQDIIANKREFTLFLIDIISLAKWNTDPSQYDDVYNDVDVYLVSDIASLRKPYGNNKFKDAIAFFESRNAIFKTGTDRSSMYIINPDICFHENWNIALKCDEYLFH